MISRDVGQVPKRFDEAVLDVSSAEQIDVERLGVFSILNFSDCHHSLPERGHIRFRSLREGPRRLEECGLLTGSNDNVFE
jgi:hypothetical protein